MVLLVSAGICGKYLHSTVLIIGRRGICSCADHGTIPFSALVCPVEMVFGTFSAQCEVPVISYHSWKYLKSEVIDMTPLYSCSVGAVYPGICPERACCPRPFFLLAPPSPLIDSRSLDHEPEEARYQFPKQVHKHNKRLRGNFSVKKFTTHPACPTIHALMPFSDAEILL